MKEEIFDSYVDKVTDKFGVTKSEVFEKNKKQQIVDARHILYYLCKIRPMKLVHIEQHMKRNGYHVAASSISHGIDKVNRDMYLDPDYKFLIDQLK